MWLLLCAFGYGCIRLSFSAPLFGSGPAGRSAARCRPSSLLTVLGGCPLWQPLPRVGDALPLLRIMSAGGCLDPCQFAPLSLPTGTVCPSSGLLPPLLAVADAIGTGCDGSCWLFFSLLPTFACILCAYCTKNSCFMLLRALLVLVCAL